MLCKQNIIIRLLTSSENCIPGPSKPENYGEGIFNKMHDSFILSGGVNFRSKNSNLNGFCSETQRISMV